MRKGEIIGGYEILKDFEVAGGMSKISFAEKNGVEYFIKEFLSPTYPVEGAPGSPETLALRKTQCDEFENHHKRVNEAIATKCSIGGNLIFAVDFFRNKTKYYKINEKIKIESIPPEVISGLSIKEKSIILRTVSKSLEILHKLNIVHGDLKPDNILIKKSDLGTYTTKLIDFDNSYFEGAVPENKEHVIGTPEYYSPELGLFFKEDDNSGDFLTTKSDIFTLGVIFTEYLTGEKPKIDKEKFNYCYEAILAKDRISLPKGKLNKSQFDLLTIMLDSEVDTRPSISEVFESLKSPEFMSEEIFEERGIDEAYSKEEKDTGKAVSKLKGKGLSIASRSPKSIDDDSEMDKKEPKSGLRGKLLD